MALGLLVYGFFGFAQEYDILKDAPADVKERIAKADELIAKKQYASANGALGLDDNEYIIYKRVEIYTQYFVQSMMHQMFIMKDLGKNEDIMELRKNFTGTAPMVMYDVEAVIADFQKNNGNKPILNLALGNFYYDVSERYGDQWLKSYDELINLAIKNYKIAEKAGFYDIYSMLACGLFAMNNEDWAEGEKKFTTVVTLNPEHATGWYNLAVSKMYLGKFAEATEPALNAIKYEKRPDWQADAYLVLADSYSYSGDTTSAIKCLKDAKKVHKNNPSINIALGEIYIDEDDYSNAEKELVAAVKIEPTAVSKAINIVGNSRNWDNLKAFCLKVSKLYPKDDMYTGYVEYMLAQAYYLLDDYKNCVKTVESSRAHLIKADAIDDYAEALDEMVELCSE